MSKYVITLLLAIAAFSFTYAYVSDLEVDGPSGTLFVTEDNNLYEINTADFTQVGHHQTINDMTDPNTLFAARRANKRVLYAFEESYTADSKFVFYPLPLKNQAVLAPSKSVVINPGLSLDSTYDQTDMIAIHSNSRNLTLVNLSTMQVEDSFYYWSGTRNFGRNVVYNHQNNHVIIFSTYVPVRGDYGLSVDEYVIQNGKFKSVKTTYKCECEKNATASPFDKVVFSEGTGCSIDYSVSPAKLWCAYPDGKKFFAFNAANLSQFQVIETTATFDNVAYDFNNQLVYAINGHIDDESNKWAVAKVHLSNGGVVKTYHNTDFRIDSFTFELDPNDPYLYIAYEDSSAVVSLNTNSMASIKTVHLNVNGTV